MESLTKGGIVLESEEIRQMSNRHIQMFMLEFYSRDSSLFATRNPSKQRNALFSSNPGGIAPEQPKSSAPPSQTESGQNELAADPWASAKMKRKLRTSSPPAKRARKHVDSTSVSSLKVEKEVKSCQKQIGSLLTAMDANLKRIVSIENALKATQSRFEQSLGETGKKILSLEKRLAQFDKKWQASQKQNEEKFERLEGRLNVAYQAAQLASVEAKTAREGSSARADLAEKLRLLEAQVAQELALRRSPINAEVGPEPDQRSRSQPQRQDESINEKIRPEMELTSTLSALTNVVERQGQQLASLVQNAVISASGPQPQQYAGLLQSSVISGQGQQSPHLQGPPIILGQQTAYPAFSNNAHQFMSPTASYPPQPHWAIPMENGGEVSRLLRHLRNYPGFGGGFQ